MNNSISRRNFLNKSAIAATGILIAPNLISCKANSKVNIAVIGSGGRGVQNWLPMENENIVALCDVDWKRAAKNSPARNRKTNTPMLNCSPRGPI